MPEINCVLLRTAAVGIGHGPENISVIKSKGVSSVAQKMRELTLNVRLVFDYLRMTKNA